MFLVYHIERFILCSMLDRQGAKKVSFTACPLGKLSLACTVYQPISHFN